MSSFDEEYSLDEDFASHSEYGLSSICEERQEKSKQPDDSTVESYIDDFASTSGSSQNQRNDRTTTLHESKEEYEKSEPGDSASESYSMDDFASTHGFEDVTSSNQKIDRPTTRHESKEEDGECDEHQQQESSSKPVESPRSDSNMTTLVLASDHIKDADTELNMNIAEEYCSIGESKDDEMKSEKNSRDSSVVPVDEWQGVDNEFNDHQDGTSEFPTQHQCKDSSEFEYIGEVAARSVTPAITDVPPCSAPVRLSREVTTMTKQRRDSQTQTQLHKSQTNTPKPKKKRVSSKCVPADFVPRCAFAQTKSTKTRQSNSKGKQDDKPSKVVKYSKRRLEQLSKPSKHHLYGKGNSVQQESSEEEKKRKSKKKYLDQYLHIERMEEMERERRDKLERAAAESAYNAGPDKKICPNCRRRQSHDEMLEGKDVCSSDRCKTGKHYFQPPKSFVLKNFEERMQRSSERRSLILERVHKERRSSLLASTGQRSRRQKELQDKVSKEGNDFHTRMAKDIGARKTKQQQLESTTMKLLIKEHSFKPQLNVKEHLIRHRKGGFDRLSAPLRRYTDPYQPPDWDANNKPKRKSTITRRKPVESPWQSTGTKPNLKKFQAQIL